MARVNVIFYSFYGHIYRMAEAVAQGARDVPGTQVGIFRVPETLSQEILEKTGAAAAQKVFAHIPVATLDNLAEADAVIIGTPTRYGNMCGQMRAFLDSTGQLWVKNTLVGKVGSVFSSSNTQHGGQETTIITTMITLLHLGYIIVGTPYSEKRQMTDVEITGGSPYGASTIAGQDGRRQPSENELGIARFQGQHVAEIAKRLFG